MVNYPRGSGKSVHGPVTAASEAFRHDGVILSANKPLPGGVIPLESVEAAHFIQLCSGAALIYPELAHVVHVPNGGLRKKSEAARMNGEGVRRGYPDYLLDVSRGGYYGWRGELKRVMYEYPSDEQYVWLTRLRTEGYWANWHRGAEAVFSDLIAYLSLETTYTPPRNWKQPDMEQKPVRTARKGKRNQ